MKLTKTIVISALAMCTLGLSAQVQTNLPLNGESSNYNINTVDTNSLYTRTDVYSFTKVNVNEIAPLIKKSLSIYGSISINETLNMIVINEQEQKLKDILKLCKKLDTENMDSFKKIKTERIPLSYNQPEKIRDFLLSQLSMDGSIQIDRDYNAIIVHDHASKIELIKEEIKKYDLAPKEVRLNVEIFEINSNGSSQIGVDIDQAMQDISVDLDKNDNRHYWEEYRKAPNYNDTTRGIISTRLDDFSSSLGLYTNLTNIIKLVDQDEGIKIVSSPSVTAINNSTAMLNVYDNISMELTPNMGESEYIKLQVDCNLMESTNGQRIINEVYVKNGEPFILGEVTQTRKIKVSRKVPILGTILPFLFSRESEVDETFHIVVFLTPEIIELEEYSKRSLEVKDEMSKVGIQEVNE